MPLEAGVRLGAHQVLGPIGAGGMGEVYRARDTRLNRDVALKVLPEAFARDPERLARFKREAQILASIGHPNIASIFGFEEAGPTQALVLELVEGPTLADRIGRGDLANEEALAIAKQIAEALEAAHEHGIVHRDLKPANIKVRADGVVKVLDFGLAKTVDPDGDDIDLSDSPTITAPALTGLGAILGTAAYMSPEQARGRPVDKRADNWAFGCVLYEMLTGARAFQGQTVTDTLAAIIRSDPDWSRLPAEASPAIRKLVARCLEKDPRQRLRDIGDARIEIENAMARRHEVAPVEGDNERSARPLALKLALGVAVVTSLIVGAGMWLLMRPAAAPVVRLSIVPPTDAPLSGSSLAITPDGRQIVYVSGNGTQLSVRTIDELTPRHLTSLGSPAYPFVSPDGQSIGFFDGLNALKTVPITGGPAVTVYTIRGAAGRGGTWAADGTIIFATDDPATGLWRVPETGGTAELLTTPQSGERDQQWPQLLPGGRAALVTLQPYSAVRSEGPRVAILDLRTAETKVLMPGSDARYVSTGHLIYGAAGQLRAIGFDLGRLETRGASMSLLQQTSGPAVSTGVYGSIGAGVASNGTLAYIPGGLEVARRRLVWVDRQGLEEQLAAPARGYVIPRISPDGSRVAVDARDAESADIWIWDLARQTMIRTTFAQTVYPVWSRDGKRVVHTTFDEARVGRLFLRASDGTAESERLTEGPNSRYASSFTVDGTRLLFREEAGATGLDIGMLTMGGQRKPETLIKTPFNELNPEVSPDGKWLAYESNQSGQNEIYVRPFPNVNAGLWQASTAGGRQPAWSPTGKELFYRSPDGSLMAMAVVSEPRFAAAGQPVRIVDGRYYSSGPYRTYDVSPDGKRFLMIKADESQGQTAAASIVIVQNWFEELKRLVPRS